jgi:hypothetical protein
MSNIRREARGHFMIKKREYLKNKINRFWINITKKSIRGLYRGVNELKRGYQHRRNLVKDGNVELLADSHIFLNKWKKMSLIY